MTSSRIQNAYGRQRHLQLHANLEEKNTDLDVLLRVEEVLEEGGLVPRNTGLLVGSRV